MTHHKPGKRETQQKLPFRLPSSTRSGFVMGKQGYQRKGKYPEDYDDEDFDTEGGDEDYDPEALDI